MAYNISILTQIEIYVLDTLSEFKHKKYSRRFHI